MQQKTPDEFIRSDGHDFHPVSIRAIPPPKRDLSILHIHHSVVGYCNPMSIASQIGDDFFRRGKGWLAVHNTLVCVAGLQYCFICIRQLLVNVNENLSQVLTNI